MTLFLLYALLLTGMGLLEARRELRAGNGKDAFFVNDRRSGPWQVGISIIASCVGGSATLGMAGLAWQAGTPAFWWLGSGACGLMALTLFLAKKVRESGASTMPEMADTFLNGSGQQHAFPLSPRRLVAVIIVPAWLAILAAQFTAMGRLTASLTGLETGAALILGAGLIVLYALLGGQASVIRSDVPQFVILLAGVSLACLFLLLRDPAQLTSAPLELVNEQFPPSRLGYFMAVLGGSYVVCPMLFGRVLSARDSSSAVSGCRIAVLGLLLCAVIVTMLGISCRGFVPPDCPPDAVLPAALEQMPAWASLALLLALLSAVLSSADSCLITASTVLCNDLLPARPGKEVFRCRIATLLLGLAALALATRGHGILSLLLMANDIYVSGVVAPVFCAMLLPAKHRPSSAVSLLALSCGGMLGLCAALTGDPAFGYCGTGLSALIVLAGAVRPCIPVAMLQQTEFKNGKIH